MSNTSLKNVRARLAQINGMGEEYQPKTGAACTCKPGQQRDNCPDCEGTGQRIDFTKIRAQKEAANDDNIAHRLAGLDADIKKDRKDKPKVSKGQGGATITEEVTIEQDGPGGYWRIVTDGKKGAKGFVTQQGAENARDAGEEDGGTDEWKPSPFSTPKSESVELTEAFTRQHYIAIAKILKENDDAQKIGLALAELFANDNPSFDKARFLDAADIRMDAKGKPRMV